MDKVVGVKPTYSKSDWEMRFTLPYHIFSPASGRVHGRVPT